ncbi:MAG: UvrD-helicase domain-containing protein, partial [Pseudomonadota bacterium]
ILNEGGIEERAEAICGARADFDEEPVEPLLCAALGAPYPPDEAAARKGALGALDRDDFEAMVAAWAAGSKTDADRAVALREAAARGDDDLSIELVASVLTKDGARRKKPATVGAQAAEPNWEALYDRLATVAEAVAEAEKAARAADRSLRLARFAAALLKRYEAAKAARSLLDFDDLVEKARALLTRAEAKEWVLYRLDGGIDHLLVDEGQDTSPAQWEAIAAIAEEFWAGEGARAGGRTSFVVGDEKQSIYSFQGAVPGAFDQMRRAFAAGLTPHGGLLEARLEHSFRSAPAILRAVDAVFDGDRAKGLSAAGAPWAHAAYHAGRAGRVELWPLIEPDASPPDPEPWAPVDMPGRREPRLRLAEAVAERIGALCRDGRLPGGGRRVRPGDVIVLLRARAPMMTPIIRALKRRGVPVAGADRLSLREELAVKDLLALMRFAATPGDDLTLAALLRSPLFEVDEEGLFDLAHGRKGSLWAALTAAEARWPHEVAALRAALADADYLRPYEFLEKALTAGGGRRRIAARLGREAEDAVDELLAQALAYEAADTPSLEGFLGWMAGDEAEIKREQSPPDPGEAGEVRVMTAHGAKGLEAPVVILPDTMRAPETGARDRLATLETPAGPRAVWRLSAKEAPAPLRRAAEATRAAEADEHRRLLYVAMTRAEVWLIVAGAGAPNKVEGTWYELAEAGLKALGAREEPAPPGAPGPLRADAAGGAPKAAAAARAPAAVPAAPGQPVGRRR